MVPWNMYNNSKKYHGVSKNSRLTENERKWNSCPSIFCTWKARYVGFASFPCNSFIQRLLLVTLFLRIIRTKNIVIFFTELHGIKAVNILWNR